MNTKEPKVTGIGGIFFKTDNPDAAKQWYNENLHLPTDKWGCSFQFRDKAEPEKVGMLQWSPFPRDTKYHMTANQQYMINYRVQNLEGLLEEFKAKGITILDDVETMEYGKFVHILDFDGNAVELWEPVDAVEKL